MINGNLERLSKRYMFSEISRIIRARRDVINLSVGDVRLPLPDEVAEAGIRACGELKSKATFRGYPPENGYDFLQNAVASYYKRRGVTLDRSEIFVSDGIKSDMGTFLNVFGRCKVLLPTPTYPAYVDISTVMGNEIAYYQSFPPSSRADVIVICSPDNPTGVAKGADELKAWVDYAISTGSKILYDAAYEAFVRSDVPHSIFEIEGARECAVEFCSLSKTAGFTGLRCGYTVVPKESGLMGAWQRIKSCCSNGVSYVTQKMAECALTSALDKTMNNIRVYQSNIDLMADALGGAEFFGAVDSPYIWLRCGDSQKEFFKLLDIYGLGVTPGAGFGDSGNQYIRINAFCTPQEASIAAAKLSKYVAFN